MLTPIDWLVLAVLGAAFGVLGQLIRIAVGIHKLQQASGGDRAAFRESFDALTLWLSLLYGVLAGILALISLTLVGGDDGASGGLDASTEFSAQVILTIMAGGYAGADFIEAFVKKHLSK